MSKQVRWQIPFVSRLGTAYRVDIYDEPDSSWFGITELQPGDTPFMTEEDNSDDFFHPVRSQSGTLQVCTLKPDGTYITLDELLPSNNIARPVRLINRDNNDAIEWQGFLSCEAYDQDYTSIPQILQLPVISVLGAMASVEVDPAKLSGLNTVAVTIEKLLEIFSEKAGISYFSQYYIPTVARGRNIISKYIDATVLFEQKEYNNENSTTYIVSGMSIKDCLARIATYMGWCCREVSESLYFFAATESSGYRRHYRQGSLDPSTGIVTFRWMVDSNETAVVSRDIVALLWAGVDHKRTVQQGAKSVEVIAKLDTSDFDLKIPQFPFGDISNLEWQNGIKYKSSTFKYLYIQINYNNAAYNNNAYSYHKGEITRTGDSSYTANYLGIGTKEEFLARLSLFPHASDQKYINANPQVAGVILIRYAIEDEQTDTHSLKEGLYCPLLPGQNGQDYPIYKMWTVKKHTFFNGKFVISAAMLFNALYRYNSINQQIMSDNVGDEYIACPGEEMTFVFRVGNKYWNGTNWVSSRSTFQIPLVDTGFDYEIEADQHLSGDVELEVMAGVSVTHVNTLYEVIFNSLEVNFQLNEDYQASDRRENHYFRLLGTNFRDEISVSTEIASNLNNQPCPSLIMNSATEAMTELNYGTAQAPDMRRPEVDLLNRLATYYGAARQRLDLIVEHPTAAPLPLLRLNGINDGKVYLPLSESRDWRTDECTLTCFETPE